MGIFYLLLAHSKHFLSTSERSYSLDNPLSLVSNMYKETNMDGE